MAALWLESWPITLYAVEHTERVLLQVAFIAGCLYTGVGILNLGWVMNFLSHSVIAGFMTGASVIIGLSQVRLSNTCLLASAPNTYITNLHPQA